MYITNATDFGTKTVNAVLAISSPQPSIGKKIKMLKCSDNLFHEGDEALAVYEVVSGVLLLSKVFENGRRQIIAFGYPGDIIGFPRNGDYHTECDALTPSTVTAHNVKHLEDSETDPLLHLRLVRAAMDEISAMQDHFMMLGGKTASEKVASFLCLMMQRVGKPLGNYTQFDFPMTRSDIADFLSVTLYTVSRTISSFKAREIIALESAKSIIVLNPEALMSMAEAN
jgi:CRP/FNR family transcriptional regulator